MSRRRPRPRRVLARLAANAGIALRDSLAWPISRFAPRDWLVLRLDHGLSDAPPTGIRGFDLAPNRPRCTAHVLAALDAAERDRRLHGVLARVGWTGIGWGQAVELASAFTRLRTAGKRVVVYAEHAGNAGTW